MGKNEIIGIILIALAVHLIINRKWIAKSQAEWVNRRSGIVKEAYESRSADEQALMIAVAGPISFLAGLGFIFSDQLSSSNISKVMPIISLGLLLVAILGFGYAVIRERTVWSITISSLFLLGSGLFLLRIYQILP